MYPCQYCDFNSSNCFRNWVVLCMIYSFRQLCNNERSEVTLSVAVVCRSGGWLMRIKVDSYFPFFFLFFLPRVLFSYNGYSNEKNVLERRLLGAANLWMHTRLSIVVNGPKTVLKAVSEYPRATIFYILTRLSCFNVKTNCFILKLKKIILD